MEWMAGPEAKRSECEARTLHLLILACERERPLSLMLGEGEVIKREGPEGLESILMAPAPSLT